MIVAAAPKQSLGLIGVGAFGALAVRHLAPHYSLVLRDPQRDLAPLANECGATVGDLKQAAGCDVVMLAVPVQKLEQVLRDIAPLVKPGALVVDVASVKVKPANLMRYLLPENVAIVGTHPLFGPQSGKNGIAGLNIVVSDIRGGRAAGVIEFLARELKLSVHQATPEEHDKELAYVQGLTHLLAKVVVALDLPEFRFKTKTYEYLEQMVEMVRYDSDELFKAIERENPFSAEAKRAFFTAAQRLEKKLTEEEA